MNIHSVLSRLISRAAQPEAPIKSQCRHITWTELPNAHRFCANCKTVQRFEKKKFMEKGDEPFEWLPMKKEDALEYLKGLEAKTP